MGTLTNDNTMSQKRAIRDWLLEYGEIDKPAALMLCDCDRLGARIWDLRHDADDPMDIKTERKTKVNRFGHTTSYAVYKLIKTEEGRNNGGT